MLRLVDATRSTATMRQCTRVIRLLPGYETRASTWQGSPWTFDHAATCPNAGSHG